MAIKTLAEINEAVARFIQEVGGAAVVVVFADVGDATARGASPAVGIAATTHNPCAMLQLLDEGMRMARDLHDGKEQFVDMTNRDPKEVAQVAVATLERKGAKLN